MVYLATNQFRRSLCENFLKSFYRGWTEFYCKTKSGAKIVGM